MTTTKDAFHQLNIEVHRDTLMKLHKAKNMTGIAIKRICVEAIDRYLETLPVAPVAPAAEPGFTPATNGPVPRKPRH